MKKTISLACLLLALMLPAKAANESRYVLCDSTNALLSGVKMEFLNINSLPVVSSWDGLIRWTFPENVTSVQVMFSGEGLDTLRTTITPTECPHWIVMTRRVRKADKFRRDDIYYTKRPRTKVVGRSSKKGKEPIAEVEVEVLSMVEDAASFREEADVISATGKRPVPEPAAANNLQAGKLTAGEVNDFAKWHLWKNILEQSHAQFVDAWKLNVRERFRVQVTNKQQFPLADVEVSLVDAEGREIFAGRTDNTGHAELWANMVKNSTGEPAAIVLSYNALRDTIREPKLFPAVNAFELNEACDVPNNVDVFFIMDATGSMGDELRYMNAELQDVIRRSQSAVEGATIRTGALVYRDHQDDYLNRLSMLTEDMSLTQAFLNKQAAGGGGDYEEAIPEALMAAVNVAEWSTHARARIAFLILDAPCHQDSTTLQLLHEQTLAAAKAGIRIVPVVCSGLREAGELLMRELALLTNGTSFFLTDDSGIGETHLKPTTDSLKVEHLNDMLVRTIIEFSRMPECNEQWADSAVTPTDEEAFIPNPFSTEDLDSVPEIAPVRPLDEVLTVRPNPCKDFFLADLPLGADATFLVDLTGKTLQILGEQRVDTRGLIIDVSGYPTGIYFIKAFIEGRWYSRKVIVR